MKLLSISISFVLSTIFLYGQSTPTISLSRVTPEGGVTYNSVTCIGEDEMGFIWFGSNDGLFRYNSIDFKRYTHFQNDINSISTNRINKLHTDLFGQMWIATENGLCLYNSKYDNFSSYELKDQFGNITGKNINSFFQTKDSIYWFADELGFGTVDIDTKRAFYKTINKKTEKSGVRIIYLDDQETIWVFFRDGEIYYQPKSSDTFHYFSKALPNIIRSVLVDKDKIWIAYEANGLLCLNMDGSEHTYFTANNTDQTALPDNQVRSLIKDKKNQIWAATYKGIALIKDFKVVSVINSEKYSEMPNPSVWSLFKDSQNNIWIGTYLGGLCFHSEYNNSFFHYTRSAPKNSLSYNVVSSFVQPPGKSELIIGTEDGNLNYFNPEANTFTTVPVEYNGRKVGTIKSLTYDKEGTLWIGTYGNGVLYQKKSDKEFKQLTLPFSTGIQALDLLVTDHGIWVSNYPLGVYFYDFNSNTFTPYRHNPRGIKTISNDNVRQIIEDKKGNLWFATRNGLNLLKNGSTEFIHYHYQENNPSSISSNIIYSILEDDEGYLWLGTNGEGLDKFDPKTGTAVHFTIKDGLPGNEIFSILQDQDNNLWITTNQGLCMFNPVSKEVRSFNNTNGIAKNRFNPNAALTSKNGEMYFGGTNGFIRFRTEDIKSNPVSPTVLITDLFVNNKKVVPGDKNGILNDVINKTQTLKLHYKQNSIGLKFATNNYIDPSKNKFKYRLLDFNDEWVELDYYGLATFTKIPAGKYTFEIKAANNDGVWNKKPTQIAIRIIPPIWLRWYAHLFYSLLFIFTLLFFRRQFINKQNLKNEIELEKVYSENEDNLHKMKLQFFTNISHEFRTPLTLIQGPVNRLLNSENQNPVENKQLTLIKNNTDRLLRLVNQFLDFRKIDSGKLKLNPVYTDINSFCFNIFSCFEEHAKHNEFDFSFKSNISNLNMDFDPDKLDKVLFNVISNAFKNTPNGGTIEVEIQNNSKIRSSISENTFTLGEEVSGDSIEISVSDNGKGIPSKNISSIFERFYQTGNNSQPGTGIGLSLTKNYILLHNGQIRVSSEVNKGTVLSICIPQNQTGTIRKTPQNNLSELKLADFSAEPFSFTEKKEDGKRKIINEGALILIAEDNSELLNYLSDLLQNHFHIAKAGNGKIAMEQVHSLFPDIIISDIMMPEMDGIELCENIKNDIRTSHIPIVLLTALDTVKDRISGLQSGADAYMPKPFDDDLLVVQIDNLLESRKKLRESFSSDETKWEDKFNSFDLDKKLLLKAINIIETNLTNVDLSVENLASNLNLSRTHLHRKLKSLTNQSATEFIRYIRLKNAVKLIKEGNLKVNEIGYAVGFNSHNYFTKSFKKQYGKSPSEFIKENSGQSILSLNE